MEAMMKKVSLEEVLAFREKRARRREKILAEFPVSLVCLGLNIPGEYKDFPWARRAFYEEIENFHLTLEAEEMTVFREEREIENAGYTAYVSVDAAPELLKTLALRMEENHPLGRLFDADVFEPGGKKHSREDTGGVPRPCLVCGGNGFACARSRAHGAEELRAAVFAIIENWLRQKLRGKIISAAIWTMISEAAITPKPGLVDRADNGSHKDMDFFTFIDSAAALLPWFGDCARAGFDSADEKSGLDPVTLFERLRPLGRMAEVIMKKASGGVNTHRGYIFSLGLLSAAYGRIFRLTENPGLAELLDLTKAMTVSLKNDFSHPRGGGISHGEAVYAGSGIQGIRGEASQGFPSVTEHALPLLRCLLNEGRSLNNAGTTVLLKILAHAEDTNIIYRGGEKVLRAVQEELRAFFAEPAGPGIPATEAIREKAGALNRRFISQNLSPGGSADLLGITLFLHRVLEDQ